MCFAHARRTWRSVRVVNPLAPRADEDLETAWPRHYPRQDAFKYTVLCTNERELYDLKRDPHETDNLVFTKGETRLAKRLDVLLQVSCLCLSFNIHHLVRLSGQETRCAAAGGLHRVPCVVPRHRQHVVYYETIRQAHPRDSMCCCRHEPCLPVDVCSCAAWLCA